jgi:adenylate cyclase
VNLTDRIESYTMGGQVLISEQTLRDAGSAVRVESVKQVIPKGVQQPINIYLISMKFNIYEISMKFAVWVGFTTSFCPENRKFSCPCPSPC